MTGVYKIFIYLNLILIIGVSEIYYRSYFIINNIKLSDTATLLVKNSKLLFNGNTLLGIYYLIIQIIGLYSWKLVFPTNYINNILFIYLFILIILMSISIVFLYRMSDTQLILLILIKLIIILNFFFITTNLLTFILLIEVVGTLYYFFFINIIFNKIQNVIKIKNLLINYIWLSLLTLILFIIAIIFIVQTVGTLHFNELSYLSNNLTLISKILLMLSISWKLGLPIFHFFKIEVYQYLSINIIFYFSIYSLLINIYVLIFLNIYMPIIFTSLKIELLSSIVLSNSIIMWRGLDSLKFFQFIAISGVNTITTICIFLLI